MAVETKWTPGPWGLSPGFHQLRIVCSDDIALGFAIGRGEEAKANAHLFATAPDLYGVAERAMRWFADNQCGGDLGWEIGEALAKARGESATLKGDAQ